MKKTCLCPCVLFIALVYPLFHAAGAETEQQGMIKSVVEADLLSVAVGEETVVYRLFGVDAPEPGQAYFENAVAQMRKKTLGKSVVLQVVAVDSLGISVAGIALEEGVDLGEWALTEGLGWWDVDNAPDATAYRKAMSAALSAKKGLWEEDIVLSPKDFRKSKGEPPVTYSVKAVAEEPVPELEAMEAPTFKAKGEAKPRLPKIDLPKEADYTSLIIKHQPRIAKNGAGEPIGFTATDISAIPGAAQLGFQNGDVISSVNGIAIRSEAQVMQLVTQLQGADRLEFDIIRGGQPTKISIPLR